MTATNPFGDSLKFLFKPLKKNLNSLTIGERKLKIIRKLQFMTMIRQQRDSEDLKKLEKTFKSIIYTP